ncbi:MAG: hypothetical protein H8E42_05125 [Nitrospinae bacterium]|nr:hypothetical protein [Nitrospinota bacterium]
MSLITEDGSLVSGAESYISVADADSFFAGIGKTAWAAMSAIKKEQSLRKATSYLELKYFGTWKGLRISSEQTLSWPRLGVIVDRFPVASNVIPPEIKVACAKLALRASAEELMPDLERKTVRETVGPITEEYDPHSTQSKTFPEIPALLRPYLSFTNGILLVR